MGDKRNYYADESSEVSFFAESLATSTWADPGPPMTDEELYQREDKYYPDLKGADYFSYPSTTTQPFPNSDTHIAVRSATFSTRDYASEDSQSLCPGGDASSSGGIPCTTIFTSSTASLASRDPENFADNFYVSPSVLNAETDPDSVWPGGATLSSYGTLAGNAYFQAEADPTGGEEAIETEIDASGPSSKRQRLEDLPDDNAHASSKRHAQSQSINAGQLPQSSSSPKGKSSTPAALKGRSRSDGRATMPPPALQLRTASRKAKRLSASYRPSTSPEEERACGSHNQVEKQYRSRLNQHFERLLAALPASDNVYGDEDGEGGADGAEGLDSNKRLSKAEVLDIARRHICTLEGKSSELKVEKQLLLDEIGRMTETGA
ncbi:hypothetical protein NKR23_g10456 [Pleurostoma richardsiae]|uniref:BHLH domain-containing protein n=1 Tax=Pleurostoma richardsiae TaxID=41990 RepID=A0AA38RK46_9PEZI|nr:hypothetical protein NKR23_g10456 [Pleurostoma richardsiae]